ncbi:MAG: 4Fe-4S binding protein [Pegethrix bostrychoides GSE-TBD4-15B]|jgi:Fe-S-cluster-containing dehydrogenase component|uniref:4Fe-4S binding protein n=1 Tax=Pegethrix bostrychoides GSE-TBD4-15B TaxID=2839662 RepID=A0A951U6R6_9CYAN|nr:4Fe-4S binding protein [Pegethrix bostrychoides GSE-TBD4-15B]
MPYFITSLCIECHRCESICPTGAITQNEHQYQINSERCNDCLGYYAVPQCWAGCPTSGGCSTLAILPKPVAAKPIGDYWDDWFKTYNRLVSRLRSNQSSTYWQRWFEAYSQVLSQQLQSTSVGAKA